VTRVDTGAGLADDGHSPTGCDVRLWTADGRGYHIAGQCRVTSVTSHHHGVLFSDGLSAYDCDGRLGTGLRGQRVRGPGAVAPGGAGTRRHRSGRRAGYRVNGP
jgi:hypothetical protein